ncbi:metalloregulator ArsR/SmtB family transcription factor [Ureibacillus chungkukjangi]|uniref:ArsR/SmtB family transcription factor n=1 Tax=Ureibacillus chungkukjangi TaxID=1202712 RepID=UPI00203D7FAE|nr:metalloregulator ArsR/SmtB family transcription factor [Ureibacillus chungkukjangi]MCM3388433.1 metalloregulator ArsR/SmtB family transcription factor [Ureibacillus chungkukjangi]
MDLQLLEKQLKAVSDANRLTLLSCLKSGEVCVCDFVDVLGISQPAVSQHLKKLEEAGIITARKLGTWKHYRIVENQSPIIKTVLDQLEEREVCNCGQSSSC